MIFLEIILNKFNFSFYFETFRNELVSEYFFFKFSWNLLIFIISLEDLPFFLKKIQKKKIRLKRIFFEISKYKLEVFQKLFPTNRNYEEIIYGEKFMVIDGRKGKNN